MEETHFNHTTPVRTDRMEIRKKNWELFRVIESKNVEEVQQLLDKFKKDERGDEELLRVLNFKQGLLEISPLILAAHLNCADIVHLMLTSGANAKVKDRIGRTPLHYAAHNGSVEILAQFINKGAEINAKIHITTWVHMENKEVGDIAPMPTVWGRTPLHMATAGLHLGCVQALLDSGASVHCVDEAGLPPLLTLAETAMPDKDVGMRNYEDIISLLIDRKCDINAAHPMTGRTIIFQAVELGSSKAVQLLLDHDINVFHTDSTGTSILHAAARSSKSDILKRILKLCQQMVNAKNKNGETPLHYATYAGSRDALRLLLEHGGDLSQANALGITVTDAIFSFLPRPTSFITETLDTNFIPNEYSINEKLFIVTLDFRILCPANNDRQMSVIMALMNSVTFAQKSKIVLHPLVEAFVRLKWDRLRLFFFMLAFIHFLYVVSLSIYITSIATDQYQKVLTWSNPVLIATSIIILLNLVVQLVLTPRRTLEFETWSMMASVAMSLSIAVWNCVKDERQRTSEWVRHVASYDILLSWVQLMFLVGRYPLKGHFTLMFYTVFRNVLKLILFFACLVFGFCLSFSIQYHNPQFSDPGLSFVRTTVMLMGEYDYDHLFKKVNRTEEQERFEGDLGWLFMTSHIIFIVFVLIGSIVLMNLMTGLAVNDIQSLQNEGNLRHMIKQAEFLSHVENVLSRKIAIIPEQLFSHRRRIPTEFRINPSAENRFCESQYRAKSKFPFRLLEAIVLLSVRNQKEKFKKQSETILLKDGISVCASDSTDKDAILEAITQMKTEMRILSIRLNKLLNTPEETEPDQRNSNKHMSRASNSSIFSFRLKRMRSHKSRVV